MREFPVNIGLTVLVAIASYFLVEKRFFWRSRTATSERK
jgi:hypothetical protein